MERKRMWYQCNKKEKCSEIENLKNIFEVFLDDFSRIFCVKIQMAYNEKMLKLTTVVAT